MPNNMEPKESEGRTLKWLVRGCAVVVCGLLAVFFVVVLQSMGTIRDQVQHVKDGPYPLSVAAGHIETDLASLQTAIEHLTTTQLLDEPLLDPSEDPINEDAIRELQADIQSQIAIMEQTSTNQGDRVEQIQRDNDLLNSRLGAFMLMCWHTRDGGASYAEVSAYAQTYLHPLVNAMLEFNQETMDSTTREVDAVYERVNEATEQTIAFSVAMLASVIVMIGVYMVMLRRKNRFEQRLRESLNAAIMEANEANEAKSSFLANMSHDIRTPMNAIMGLTIIAEENLDDPLRVRQCLTRIATSSQHLLSLINDILDMNKIEAGKVTLAHEEFSVEDLAEEIEAIFEAQPPEKRRHTSVTLRDVDRPILVGDVLRLRQVLLNLTSNALKYSEPGDSVSLLIAEEPASSPGRALVTFQVEDTGIGMAEDFVQRIFDPFEREANDYTVFTEGTGLGMAITKNLVDLMGGTIDVQSEVGVGTCMTIRMELEAAPDQSPRRTSAQRRAESGAGDGKSVRGTVLIVEDNEINMDIARQLVESRGARVEGAADGIEAVAKVSDAPEGTYDLILMDVQMPRMNGLDATRAIRSFLSDHNRAQTPIVAMTANAFDSDRQDGIEAGMDGFLTKPINIHELEEALGQYLAPGASDDEGGSR